MQQIMDGLKLMVMGMGMVLIFLVIMIWCMKLMAKLLAPIKGILDPVTPAPKKKASKSDDDAQKAAAAVAVLQAFNNGK